MSRPLRTAHTVWGTDCLDIVGDVFCTSKRVNRSSISLFLPFVCAILVRVLFCFVDSFTVVRGFCSA